MSEPSVSSNSVPFQTRNDLDCVAVTILPLLVKILTNLPTGRCLVIASIFYQFILPSLSVEGIINPFGKLKYSVLFS